MAQSPLPKGRVLPEAGGWCGSKQHIPVVFSCSCDLTSPVQHSHDVPAPGEPVPNPLPVLWGRSTAWCGKHPLRPRWTPAGIFWASLLSEGAPCVCPLLPIPLACTEHWEIPGKEISPSLWTASHRGTLAAALNELFSHLNSRPWRFRCQLLSSPAKSPK